MASVTKTIGGLCLPSQVYLVFSVIVLIMGAVYNFGLLTILVKALFIGLWTWILNLICKEGYSVISWILVLLPIISIVLVALLAVDMTKKVQSGYMNMATTKMLVMPVSESFNTHALAPAPQTM
jgi:hypothetical protein